MRRIIKEEKTVILFILALSFLFILFFHIPKALYFGHSAYNHEPIWRGTIAKDLIDGLRASNLFDYEYTSYEGGTLVTGILAVPFFLLFGDSFFSLSLVPISFALLSLILMYHFLFRYFGKNAAIIASFLFIFSPPMYIFRQVCAYGNFTESIFFTIIIFFTFYEIFFHENHKHASSLWMLLGLISGFGIYFCYVVFIPVVVCVGSFLILGRHKLFRGGNFFIFLFFFLLGFSPWLLYNIPRHFSGIILPSYSASVPNISLFDLFSGTSVTQFISSFSYIIPHMKDVLLIEGNNIYFYTVTILVLGSISFMVIRNVGLILKAVLASRRGRKPKHITQKTLQETFIILYVILYGIIWALYPIGHARSHLSHYLYPVYPFIFIAIALCINTIETSKVRWFYYIRYPASFVLILCLIGIGLMNVQSYHLNEYIQFIGRAFKIKGYSLEYTSRFYSIPSSIYVEDFIESDLLFINQKTPGSPWGRMFDIYKVYQENEKKHTVYKDYSSLSSIEKHYLPYVYLMIGINIGDSMGKDFDPTMNITVENRIPDNLYRHCFYEGAALSVCNRFFKDVLYFCRSGSVSKNIPREYQHYFYTECGRRIGEKYAKNMEGAFDIIENFDSSCRSYLYLGFIWSLNTQSIKDNYGILMSRLDNQYKSHLFRHWGSLFLLNKGNRSDAESAIKEVPGIYRHYYIQGLGRSSLLGWSTDALYGENLETKLIELGYIFTFFNTEYQPHLYYGLGLALSLKTFGKLSSDMKKSLDKIIPQIYKVSFYRGYDFGLFLRFYDEFIEMPHNTP